VRDNQWGKVTMSSVFPNATVGAATMALAAGLSPPAQAVYTVTFVQVADPSQPLGSNVVATGGGTIDLTDLQEFSGTLQSPSMQPSAGIINTGASDDFAYYRPATGPTSFGSGGYVTADSGSGCR
jgi:hypothetical protein